MGLKAEDAALVGEEEEKVVGIDDEELGNEILFPRGHPLDAFATSVLRAVGLEGNTFDVAFGADRDGAGLMRDQVLGVEVGDILSHDRGPTVTRVEFRHLGDVVHDETVDLLGIREESFEVRDSLSQILELFFQLATFEGGEPAELHVQHGLRLAFAEDERALLERLLGGIG